ncbi:hypothetical protein DENSPDRAFT_421363 [Dentipellis sp. KUC8613]|nr:hypothetical protein DENSPDRAFT_421363 [Dentipellis sp. KUC8613]
MASHAAFALDIGSQLASVVPLNGLGLQGLFDIAKQIVELLEKVKADKTACAVLAKKAAELVVHVTTVADARRRGGAASAGMQANVTSLKTTLQDIEHKLQTIVQSKTLKRILHRARNADTLKECTAALDDAWRKFDTTALLLIQQTQDEIMARQDYDETHRLFRLCDIRVRKFLGPSATNSILEEEIGELCTMGALVKVCKLRPGADLAAFWRHLQRVKNVRHPQFPHLLGYSTHSSKIPFYVSAPLTAGPFMRYLEDSYRSIKSIPFSQEDEPSGLAADLQFKLTVFKLVDQIEVRVCQCGL